MIIICLGNEYHEFLRQRHFREDCCRSRQTCPLQQEDHHHFPWDPNCRSSSSPWRVGQARRVWGDQGRHQVHQLQILSSQVGLVLLFLIFFWSSSFNVWCNCFWIEYIFVNFNYLSFQKSVVIVLKLNLILWALLTFPRHVKLKEIKAENDLVLK